MKSESCGGILQHVVLVITAMLLLPAPCSRGDPVVIQVTNQFGGIVECHVIRIETDGKETSLGHTESGKLTTESCPNGCCLLFVPDESSTYFRDKTHCPLRNKNVTLRRMSGEVQNLAAQLNDSPNDKKEAAKDALIANEIANRATIKSIKEAYRACAQIQISKFLDVEKPLVYDQSQKQLVTTAELDDCVRKYQVKKGLKPTGNLDDATLTKAAGTTAEQLLSNPSHD
jgi:hypothetical protein